MALRVARIQTPFQMASVDEQLTPPPDDTFDGKTTCLTSPVVSLARQASEQSQIQVTLASRSPARTQAKTIRPPPSRKHTTAANSWLCTPRPYEDLFRERYYLYDALQGQNARRQRMLEEFWVTKEGVDTRAIAPGKPAQKARRHLRSLRRQMDLVTEQEQPMLLRYTEVNMELQSREAFSLAHQQYLQQPTYTAHPSSASTASLSNVDGSCCWSVPSPLSPTSSCSTVIPGDRLFAAAPGGTVDWQTSTDTFRTRHPSKTCDLETVDECLEDTLGNCNLDFVYVEERVDEAEKKTNVARRSACSDDQPSHKVERRLSLPSLRSLWPSMN